MALVRGRTHRGPPLRVTLYERENCGLCAQAFRALRRLGLDQPLEIERVDVDSDPTLRNQYTLTVPVIKCADREIEAAGLTDGVIAQWLRESAQ